MVGDVFISVFSRFSVKNIHDTGKKRKKLCFSFFASIYNLLSIEIGLNWFGYIYKRIN